MFKKNQRFSFKKGLPAKSFNTIFFTLKFEKNINKPFTCAVVVSKKVDKRAVVRNKLKRRFSHALKELINGKNLKYNLVFFLKKAGLELTFEGLSANIKDALKKTKIIL